jgi:hypothetical protein
MKYQYALYTWGGFYNDNYRALHRESKGLHLFDSNSERSNYLSYLKILEEEHGYKYLAHNNWEGYDCATTPVLHRVSSFNGEEVYTHYDMNMQFDYESCKYHLNKWYPSHNDYPFGEGFDYNQRGFKIVKEWVTGSFEFEGE